MALLKGEGTHQILYGGVDIFSGIRHNRGYLARPDHAGSFPTVLLIHGRAGISSSVKSLARRLARHGLAVVGPDLFRGARAPRKPLPSWPEPTRLTSDLRDTLRWMESPDTPWVRSDSIGALALDRAASAALRLTHEDDGIRALALISPVLTEAAAEVEVPVIGFFGKEDDIAGPEQRRATQDALDHGEWVLYGGAGHGLIDESAEDYRWDVAVDIGDRTVGFFARSLKS